MHDSYIQSYLDTRKPRIVGIGRKVLGRHRDGTAFPLYLSIGEFPHEGRSHFVGICHDATTEQEQIEQIRDLATYDELTRVLNRRSVVVELTTLLERAEHEDEGVAVLFIDLDNFKQINDRFGHQVGDRVLQVMATRLKAQLRDGDRLARVGGDEFVAVIQTDEDETIRTRSPAGSWPSAASRWRSRGRSCGSAPASASASRPTTARRPTI